VLAGARVVAYEAVSSLNDGNRAEGTTGSDGKVVLERLLGWGYPLQVTVEAPGYLGAVHRTAGEDRDAGKAVVVRLLVPAVVHGVYRDGHTKAPKPHARVDLLHGDGRSRMKDDHAGTATTDAEGRYRFDALRPGRYTLAPAGGRSASVALEEGETKEVPLTDGNW
jgi:hypothetical protein